ncbi:MAG: hypothetical protein V7L29_14405 [Nostoc sp.]
MKHEALGWRAEDKADKEDKENNPCPMPYTLDSIFLECDRHLLTSVK